MKMFTMVLTAATLTTAANAGGVTLDDLSIGTLTAGDSVTGDTNNSTNDMNGSLIVTSIFQWSGNDDVYTLNWDGSNLVVDLLYTAADGDLDLIMFANNTAGAVLDQSLTTSDDEQLSFTGLAAGTYWISIDGWDGGANSYTLNISGVPTPGSIALLGLGGVAFGRRRR